jgi:hypothetical protein
MADDPRGKPFEPERLGADSVKALEVDYAMIRPRILVAIRSARRRDVVQSPLQNEGRIRGLFLGDAV